MYICTCVTAPNTNLVFLRHYVTLAEQRNDGAALSARQCGCGQLAAVHGTEMASSEKKRADRREKKESDEATGVEGDEKFTVFFGAKSPFSQ